ncbi:MAG: hypothetical protein AB1714_09555 [Acidobacteriota bacterium]
MRYNDISQLWAHRLGGVRDHLFTAGLTLRRVAAYAVCVVSAMLGPHGFAHGQDKPAGTFADLLDLATQYATSYEEALSSVVAEESYEQRVYATARPIQSGLSLAAPTAMPQSKLISKRLLRSDYLLVKVEAVDGWVPFRDIYEVDGEPVRERDDRLVKLFLESPATALEQSSRIMSENARFNAGGVTRNLNLPTLVLTFLTRERRPRFTFALAGSERVGGVSAVRIKYTETARPPIISGGPDGDLVSNGTIWVDPSCGRVLRTELLLKSTAVKAKITVAYGPDTKANIWVPVRMTEKYESAQQTIEGEASYSNFRRFQVETTPSIE